MSSQSGSSSATVTIFIASDDEFGSIDFGLAINGFLVLKSSALIPHRDWISVS